MPSSRNQNAAFVPFDDETAARARREMVSAQIASRGIRDPRVLAAMREVPRHRFVPQELRPAAHADGALAIGSGQTISQPFTVAMMCEAAHLTGPERVLEVGTGSGYAAAVLARLAREVHTVERLEELAQEARQRLAELAVSNVTVHTGDGTLGLPQQAPFDAIIVAAAAPRVPERLCDQLAEGGRLIVPVGPSRTVQQMLRVTRHGERWHSEDLGSFCFVPLIGDDGWAD